MDIVMDIVGGIVLVLGGFALGACFSRRRIESLSWQLAAVQRERDRLRNERTKLVVAAVDGARDQIIKKIDRLMQTITEE